MTVTPLATGARRTAWVPVVAGLLCGVITVLVYGALVGTPVMTFSFLILGVAGLLIGLVSLGLVLLATALTARPLQATAIAGAGSVALAALAGWILTGGYYLVPMVITAAVTVIVHVLAAREARGRVGSLVRDSGPRSTGRVLTLISGGFVALVLSMAALGMLREQLHVGCAYFTEGEGTGSWVCSDGIGYIFPGLTLLFGSAAALLIGILVVLAASSEKTRRRALTSLGFAPLLWTAGWLSSVTLPRDDALPAGETWASVWFIHVGIAALLALAGAVLAASTPAHRSSRPRWIAAGSLLLAATIVQPGLSLATVASAALLVAARLIPLTDPVALVPMPGDLSAD